MDNLTGIWYNPDTDGSGLSIHDTENALVVYWYGYLNGMHGEDDGQIWMIGQPEDPEQRYKLTFRRPAGTWMGDEYTLGDPVAYGDLVMEEGVLMLDYKLVALGPCAPVMPSPVWSGCNGRWELRRLV